MIRAFDRRIRKIFAELTINGVAVDARIDGDHLSVTWSKDKTFCRKEYSVLMLKRLKPLREVVKMDTCRAIYEIENHISHLEKIRQHMKESTK